MLWGWAPFEKEWNQEFFVFNLEFAGAVYQAVGSCIPGIPRSHQYYSSGLTFWSVDWVCHPPGWVQIKTCRNQHVLEDVERITRASTTLQVCLRCDDSLWSWHALGLNVVSAYHFFPSNQGRLDTWKTINCGFNCFLKDSLWVTHRPWKVIS